MRVFHARNSTALRLGLRVVSAARFRLALVSSNSESTVRQVLGVQAPPFESYDCGASLFAMARLLKRAARRLKVERHQAIYVGDEARDVEAAHSAGVTAAAVLWGYAREEAFQSHLPLDTFRELNQLSKFLLGAKQAQLG